MWDGKEDDKSAVIVADYSSNGTFVRIHASSFPVTRVTDESLSPQINGIKIGRDKTAILKEGNEIAFGTATPQPGSVEDYRMSLFIQLSRTFDR